VSRLFKKKPGNVFIDAEGNVRLGDFGLATRHRNKPEVEEFDFQSNEFGAIYDAIEDISNLLGGSTQSASVADHSETGESMTGGVGTTFYRAPEQEGIPSKFAKKGDSSYNVQADIFSLGIILFEMFYPPFETVRAKNDCFWCCIEYYSNLLLLLLSFCAILLYSLSTWKGQRS
jgi:serine/threonine protein kinase